MCHISLLSMTFVTKMNEPHLEDWFSVTGLRVVFLPKKMELHFQVEWTSVSILGQILTLRLDQLLLLCLDSLETLAFGTWV